MTTNVLFPGEKHVRTVHGNVSDSVTNVTAQLRGAFERVTPTKAEAIQCPGFEGRFLTHMCTTCGKPYSAHKRSNRW